MRVPRLGVVQHPSVQEHVTSVTAFLARQDQLDVETAKGLSEELAEGIATAEANRAAALEAYAERLCRQHWPRRAQ